MEKNKENEKNSNIKKLLKEWINDLAHKISNNQPVEILHRNLLLALKFGTEEDVRFLLTSNVPYVPTGITLEEARQSDHPILDELVYYVLEYWPKMIDLMYQNPNFEFQQLGLPYTIYLIGRYATSPDDGIFSFISSHVNEIQNLDNTKKAEIFGYLIEYGSPKSFEFFIEKTAFKLDLPDPLIRSYVSGKLKQGIAKSVVNANTMMFFANYFPALRLIDFLYEDQIPRDSENFNIYGILGPFEKRNVFDDLNALFQMECKIYTMIQRKKMMSDVRPISHDEWNNIIPDQMIQYISFLKGQFPGQFEVVEEMFFFEYNSIFSSTQIEFRQLIHDYVSTNIQYAKPAVLGKSIIGAAMIQASMFAKNAFWIGLAIIAIIFILFITCIACDWMPFANSSEQKPVFVTNNS